MIANFHASNFEDLELLDNHPDQVRSFGYDIVMNGYELGGGSIRIHDAKLQSQIFDLLGIQKQEAEEAVTGDIIGIAGMKEVNIGETITDRNNPEALPVIEIDEPTLSINFLVNNSPFSGKEGKFVTSRQLRDRLFKEMKQNVALRVQEENSNDTFKVSGRGELHLRDGAM